MSAEYRAARFKQVSGEHYKVRCPLCCAIISATMTEDGLETVGATCDHYDGPPHQEQLYVWVAEFSNEGE